MNTIEENAYVILRVLADRRDDRGRDHFMLGAELMDQTNLSAGDINDAATILVENGYAEWRQTLGSAPFRFRDIVITPRGRYSLERAAAQEAGPNQPTHAVAQLAPAPVGSPYGFTDEDWESVAESKGRADRLKVVLGFQFSSDHYDSEALRENVGLMFARAIDRYRTKPGALDLQLDYCPLAAGYGEHLFNEIARDIISSDIAVFDTSDLNPNVMVEMGVALTWGIRVLPIKKEGCPKPPSDISGQTWADYTDSASNFADPEHDAKLTRMIERALRKKA